MWFFIGRALFQIFWRTSAPPGVSCFFLNIFISQVLLELPDVCPTSARRLPADVPDVGRPTCPTFARHLPDIWLLCQNLQEVETPDFSHFFSRFQAPTGKFDVFSPQKPWKLAFQNNPKTNKAEARCGVKIGPPSHPHGCGGGVSCFVLGVRLGGVSSEHACLLSVLWVSAGRLPSPASPPIQMTQGNKGFLVIHTLIIQKASDTRDLLQRDALNYASTNWNC